MANDAETRLPIPAALLPEMRALHLRKAHHERLIEHLRFESEEFDRLVLSFAVAHAVDPHDVKSVDLDGGALVLVAKEPVAE